MALLVGQMQVSAAGRERDVIELVCVRCRRVISRRRVGQTGRAGPVRTIRPPSLDAGDGEASTVLVEANDPMTSCTRCGKNFPIHQAGLLRGEILCMECAPPRLLSVRRRVGRAGRAGPVRTLGLCRTCAGELARTGGDQAAAELRRRER